MIYIKQYIYLYVYLKYKVYGPHDTLVISIDRRDVDTKGRSRSWGPDVSGGFL